MIGKLVNPRLFEEEIDSFSGFIFIDNGTFIDKKFREVLESAEIEFYIINMMHLTNKFIKMLNLELGPNFYRFKDGEIVIRIHNLITLDNLRDILKA